MTESDRATMQLALDALENARPSDATSSNYDVADAAFKQYGDALVALRKKVAQPLELACALETGCENIAQSAELSSLAKRQIFDAIRSAYSIGYSDARDNRAVPGDSGPGYKGSDVEADHGGALLYSLNQTIAQSKQPQPADSLQEDGVEASDLPVEDSPQG